MTRKLKAALSIPDHYLPLVESMIMSDLGELHSVANNPEVPQVERKIAALVMEMVRSGDWEPMGSLIDRILTK